MEEQEVVSVTVMPVSAVCVGSFNPSILNHDFLAANQIVPWGEFGIAKAAGGRQPFEQFTSTPVLAFVDYAGLQIVVESGKLNVVCRDVEEEQAIGLVAEIATRYLKVLPYTPVTVFGLNAGREIHFDSREESMSCLSRLLNVEGIAQVFGPDAMAEGVTLRGSQRTLRWKVDCRVQPSEPLLRIAVNHEYDFVDAKRMRAALSTSARIAKRAKDVTERLLGKKG